MLTTKEREDLAKPLDVLVIGEAWLNRWQEGTVGRVTPDAPCPVFQAGAETKFFGGALSLASHLCLRPEVDKVAVASLVLPSVRDVFLRVGQKAGLKCFTSVLNTGYGEYAHTFYRANNQIVFAVESGRRLVEEMRGTELIAALSELSGKLWPTQAYEAVIVTDRFGPPMDIVVNQFAVKRHVLRVLPHDPQPLVHLGQKSVDSSPQSGPSWWAMNWRDCYNSWTIRCLLRGIGPERSGTIAQFALTKYVNRPGLSPVSLEEIP